MRGNQMKNRSVIALSLGFVLLVASCGAGDNAVGTSAELRTADEAVTPIASYITPFESYGDLASFSDAVLHVRLVDVIDGYRYPIDPEGDVAQGVSSEQLGLVFDVLQTYSGGVDSKQITVDWAGYRVDLESRKRLSRIELGTFDHRTLAAGDEYVVAVLFAEGIGYRIVSPDGFLKVDVERGLVPTVGALEPRTS